MNPSKTPFLAVLAVLFLLLLNGCVPSSFNSSGFVVGEDYRLGSGQTVNNDLTVIGGSVLLEQNTTVHGDVVVIGGDTTVDGTILGNLSTIGGQVTLKDHAVIHGQLDTIGGAVQRSDQAVIENQGSPSSGTRVVTSPLRWNFDPIFRVLTAIFQAFTLAALAVLASLFLLRPLDRTGRAVLAQPAASGGVGCLTLLVLVIMAITIILLPFSIVGLLAAAVALLFGWLSLGLLLGRKIAVWLKQDWSDPLNAGLGTLVLSLFASIAGIIPCIGWILPSLAGLVALGAVVLTRFGTQTYPAVVVAPVRALPYLPIMPPSADLDPDLPKEDVP